MILPSGKDGDGHPRWKEQILSIGWDRHKFMLSSTNVRTHCWPPSMKLVLCCIRTGREASDSSTPSAGSNRSALFKLSVSPFVDGAFADTSAVTWLTSIVPIGCLIHSILLVLVISSSEEEEEEKRRSSFPPSLLDGFFKLPMILWLVKLLLTWHQMRCEQTLH